MSPNDFNFYCIFLFIQSYKLGYTQIDNIKNIKQKFYQLINIIYDMLHYHYETIKYFMLN